MATEAFPKQIFASTAADLAAIWQWLCAGSITYLRSTVREGQVEGEFESTTPPGGTSREMAVLRRLLLGQSLKLIALEDRLSVATVSVQARRAVARIGGTTSGALSFPLILVMAATADANLKPSTELAECPAPAFIKAAIAVPLPPGYSGLSAAEKQVFWLVCGSPKLTDIATARRCSERTAANILAAIFRKLDVGNRPAMMALVARTALASP